MKQRKWARVTALSIATMAWAAADGLRAQESEITRFSVDGGAARSAGGFFELSGTAGQPDAAALSGGRFSMAGGFWFGQAATDCNTDGGVDQFDYAAFEACLSGPGGGWPAPHCACFDLEADGDVDLLDWVVLQISYSG
ncbi:MAG: hypothetical protein ACYTHJ_05030 [Planctomycetota bacterium]|jgi:hypothetical protein